MVLGVDVGPQELLVLLVVFVSPIWGIIDAALRPETQWQGAGQNKVAWILAQLFLGFIGLVIYFAAIRPKLKRVSADTQASPE